MAKKERKFKKSDVNLEESRKIQEDQEKALELKELYIIKIKILVAKIKSMFEELTENGKIFSMATIEDEIDALPPILEEKIKEMLDTCQKFANTTNCEMNVNSTTISDLTPLLRHNIAGIHALLGIDYHLVDFVSTRPDNNTLYRLLSNKLLPKEALDLEKKTGLTLPELKKKVQTYESTVEEFEDLYEEILDIDNRDETLKGRGIKQEDSSIFSNLANSFIFNPFGLFKSKEKNTEKSDNKTEESSWWKVTSDFKKWLFNNSSEEKQISLKTNTLGENNSEGDTKENLNKTSFGDELVIDTLHEGYQTVLTYAIESSKLQCFTSAIIETMKANTQCLMKRNQAAHKHMTSDKEDSSINELPNQDQTALVITNPENSLATTYNNVKSIKDTVDECNDLSARVQNLADNCHYMFSMKTSNDNVINELMKNVTIVKAEVRDGEVLLNINGLAITFHTMGEPAESSATTFIEEINECTGECLLSGEESHTTLRLGNGEEE
jgi:hypothetical protein